jgi:glycolate oxidase FAD binding subunit
LRAGDDELNVLALSVKSRAANQADAIAGALPQHVFEPSSVEELVEVVRVTARDKLALAAIGSGTTLGLGNPPSRYDVAVRMRRLNRIVDYAPEDQVVVVEAGATLGELQSVLREHGQRLAIDPPGGDAMTIGGMIATNAYGPGVLRYGTLKDAIVGIEIVRADGVLARAGGKVVKNVAGFDVSKLMVGSLGTLAIVSRATFRVHPLPEATRSLHLTAAVGRVFPFILALREAQLEPSAIVARVAGAHANISVTFEGFGPGVGAQVERCIAIAGEMSLPVLDEREPGAGTAISDVTPGEGREAREVEGQPQALLKATFPPTNFSRVAGEVGSGVAYPSQGVMYFGRPSTSPRVLGAEIASDPAERGSAVVKLRQFFESMNGTLVVWDMPRAWRGEIDAWGTPPPSSALMRALKERFDPDRRLSPGRFVGGI